jgi:hypothetical protein
MIVEMVVMVIVVVVVEVVVKVVVVSLVEEVLGPTRCFKVVQKRELYLLFVVLFIILCINIMFQCTPENMAYHMQIH